MTTFKFRVWNSLEERFTINTTIACQLSTERKDKNGKEIFAGDIVKLHNKSKYTKKEYWYPIYEVVWNNNFEFGLKYLGGGKNGDSNNFNLRYYSNQFQVIGNVCAGNVVIINPMKA